MPTPLIAEQVRGVALTTIVTTSFAAFWGLSGSFAVPGPARIPAALVVLLITGIWFGVAFSLHRAARQLPDASEGGTNPFQTRAYRFAVLAQFIAMPIAGRLLTVAGYPDAVMPAIAAIVGLHFLGLIPAFQSWRFAGVASAMVLLALISLAIAPRVPLPSGEPLALRAAVVGFGCALILWASIVPIVLATRQQLARPTV